MNTNKPAVKLIAEICRAMGIRYAVFSPGSRSAPLVIAFSQIPEIECLVIPDERVAGYFALGLAQQTQIPVAVICTSGTAVLNLGPALCEAYYQHIPMLFLTADRPAGAEERGENQAIKQSMLFKEMTVASYDIDADITDRISLSMMASKMEHAVYDATKKVPGPVHVNVRMSEPLYDLENPSPLAYQPKLQERESAITSEKSKSVFLRQLASTKKKLIVLGMQKPSTELSARLSIIAKRSDIVILTESAANLDISGAIYNYDACLDIISGQQLSVFAPDLVITLGNQIISKKLRQALKLHKPLYHWDISPYNEHRRFDIFDVPTNEDVMDETTALDCLLDTESVSSDYAEKWQLINQALVKLTRQFLEKTPFCDLKVYQILNDTYPPNANLQYGNSTPIRYSNFFKHDGSLTINANRGTSGIDGSVSTAAGAAYATKQLTICVVGDVSFLYDSNALWNNYLTKDFRIIIINNSGGNIFRLLNGPGKVNDFEKFFETQHHLNAKHLAAMHNIPYYFCEEQSGLEKTLETFYDDQNGRPAILEIKTDGILSAETYKAYFQFLKNNTAS